MPQTRPSSSSNPRRFRMRTHLTLVPGVLVVLLIGSAILFLVGSTIERNHRHHETAAAKSSEASGGEKSANGEAGAEGSKPTEPHTAQASGEAGATILGVNTESLALSIVAVVLSFVLA